MVKKLFLIFINVIIISLFAALPVSADDFDFSSAFYTGNNFGWHYGAPIPAPSVGNHFVLEYFSSTDINDNPHNVRYYSISSDCDRLIANIDFNSNRIYSWKTSPSVSSPCASLQTAQYSFDSNHNSWDRNLPSPHTFNLSVYTRDFSSGTSKYCIITDLPVYDSSGNLITTPTPAIDFDMSYFMDGSGVYHHYISKSSTIAGNTSYDVDWFLFDGSYTFPVSVQSDTIVKRTLTETYSNTNLRKYQEYFAKWYQYVYQSGALGVGSLGVVNPQFDYIFVNDHTITGGSRILNNNFDPSSIGSVYRYLNGDTLTTHVTQSTLDFDAQLFLKTRGGSDFSNSSDVAICACVHDNSNNKYILLVHKFNINDCLTALNSVKHANDDSNVSAPEPSNISDWQSLAEYLKNLQNNTTINNYINNNNLVDNITSFPWGNVINGGVGGALNEFPWVNVINGGVGGALNDFLPNLSSEFDTVFSGLFNDFTVPSQAQIDDIEDEIQAEQDQLHDKLAFVEDVKTEIYFLSSSIASAGSSEPHFKQKLVYYVPAFNENDGSYYFTFDETDDEITFFRGAWIDVNSREALKDLITVFASLAVLLYIWHTLPSTVGNMPRGD